MPDIFFLLGFLWALVIFFSFRRRRRGLPPSVVSSGDMRTMDGGGGL